jgi:hypothetical protein
MPPPPIPVNLVVEDELSDAVVRRLLRHVRRRYLVGRTYGFRGNAYLRKNMRGWNNAARGTPFIVITDLDRYACPPELREDWVREGLHPNLIFHVAVREIEAWVLADRVTFSKFLAIAESKIPLVPEAELDPKATLIAAARRSRIRSVRERLAPRSGSTARQGPDYNACLIEFVAEHWNVRVAAAAAQSLARMIRKLEIFTPVWR